MVQTGGFICSDGGFLSGSQTGDSLTAPAIPPTTLEFLMALTGGFVFSDGGFLSCSQTGDSLTASAIPPKHTAFLMVLSGGFVFSDGGFLSRSQTGDSLTAPAIPPKMLGSFPGDDDNSLAEQTYELPIYNEPAYLVSTTFLFFEAGGYTLPTGPKRNPSGTGKTVLPTLWGSIANYCGHRHFFRSKNFPFQRKKKLSPDANDFSAKLCFGTECHPPVLKCFLRMSFVSLYFQGCSF